MDMPNAILTPVLTLGVGAHALVWWLGVGLSRGRGPAVAAAGHALGPALCFSPAFADGPRLIAFPAIAALLLEPRVQPLLKLLSFATVYGLLWYLLYVVFLLLPRIRRSGTPAAKERQLYADERTCALSILEKASVAEVYRTLGADLAVIQAQAIALEPVEASAECAPVLRSGSPWHQHTTTLGPPVDMDRCLLVGLLVHGNAATRDALTAPGGLAGDASFLVARGQPEPQMRTLWPPAGEQTGRLLMLNDDFTPMLSVVEALMSSFGLDEAQAIGKMILVHQRGHAALDGIPGARASDTCLRLNREWRARGLPLYCVPERDTTPDILRPRESTTREE